jgi:hypothetical protein
LSATSSQFEDLHAVKSEETAYRVRALNANGGSAYSNVVRVAARKL